MKFHSLLAAVFLSFATSPAFTADWHMWGGSQQRNMINTVEKNIPDTWDVATGKNIKWVAQLGSQAFSTPIIAGGKIFVGTNNQFERQPKIKGDKGVMMCFREADGKFLWQNVHDKLPSGRVNDWPMQGICSTCYVDGNRVYYVSNRCELVCADVEGANDGSGKIVWSLDMMKDLGVFPHNMSASSPNIDGMLVYIVTGNGVDESHIVIPAPDAPSFIAVNKMTGEVVWDKVGPGDKILHGQWSSPTIGVIGGVKQAIFPGGDGRLYAYEAETGKELWSFQCNPEGTVYKLGGRGTRNELLATPVIYNDRVYITMGQDPEHGEGRGHMYAIDATKLVYISKTCALWRNDEVNRGLATVSIYDNILYHCDLTGIFRAIDPETGKVFWKHEMGSAVWSSPYYVDGKVLMGDEDGHVVVFAAGKEEKILNTIDMGGSIYTTPVAANGVLYINTREKLYAIQQGASCDVKKVN
ncbi:MAG: PQQ-binding-like beta-propeller repeat protein [Thermoguttaceae bacterium]